MAGDRRKVCSLWRRSFSQGGVRGIENAIQSFEIGGLLYHVVVATEELFVTDFYSLQGYAWKQEVMDLQDRINAITSKYKLEEACEFYNAEFIDFKLFLVENNDASKLYFKFKKKQVLSMQEYIEEQAGDVESYLDSNGTRRVEAIVTGKQIGRAHV